MDKRKFRKKSRDKIVVIEGNLDIQQQSGKLPRKVSEQQRDNRKFKQASERPVSFPLQVGRVPHEIKEGYGVFDISFRTADYNGIKTTFIAADVDKVEFSSVDLARLGIMADHITRGSGKGVWKGRSGIANKKSSAYWSLSVYDLLYLLENGVIAKDNLDSRKDLYRETIIWMNGEDPNFMEKYLIYRTLKKNGYYVSDGYRYGYDFVVYEEPTDAYILALQDLPPKKVGNVKDSLASAYGIGLIDLAREDDPLSMHEIIKGQHLADKSDMRYYVARIDGARDDEGHLISLQGEVQMYGMRLEKLEKTKTQGKKAVIVRRTDEP